VNSPLRGFLRIQHDRSFPALPVRVWHRDWYRSKNETTIILNLSYDECKTSLELLTFLSVSLRIPFVRNKKIFYSGVCKRHELFGHFWDNHNYTLAS
jgi:hypothetical protein